MNIKKIVDFYKFVKGLLDKTKNIKPNDVFIKNDQTDKIIDDKKT